MRAAGKAIRTAALAAVLVAASALLATTASSAVLGSGQTGNVSPGLTDFASIPWHAQLDPGFGQAGQLILPLKFESAPWRPPPAVLMHDGSLVVSTGRTLKRLTPEGQLDESFGEGGTLIPPSPPGGRFEIDGLAVDLQDRLIIAGTSHLPKEDFRSATDFQAEDGPLAVSVARYLSNGLPDPSFGQAGVMETDFGFPPPRDESGQQLLARPWVEATGVAVDAQSRIILTGGVSAGVYFGCSHDWFWNTLTYAAFVARLTEAGAPDTSFGGGDGVFGGRSSDENPLHIEFSVDPAVGPGGEVQYSSGELSRCAATAGNAGLAQLTAAGEPRIPFGAQGAVPGWIIGSSVERDGSIVVLEGLPWKEGERHRARVRRLEANGMPDLSFGQMGQAVVTLNREWRGGLTSLAIDSNGRILLGGVVTTTRRHRDRSGHAETSRRRHWLLIRLRSNGLVDRSFGTLGRITTRFGSLAVGGPSLLLDLQGRAVMLSRYRGPKGKQGFAVARYVFSD